MPLLRKFLQFGLRQTGRLLPKKPWIRQMIVDERPVVVWLNEHIGRRLFFVRQFEKAEQQVFRSVVRSGDVVFDVGANIGLHSISLASFAGSGGKVYAFEPFRRNALLVALNAEINDLENIEVVQSMLSDSDGGKFAPIFNGAGPIEKDFRLLFFAHKIRIRRTAKKATRASRSIRLSPKGPFHGLIS